MGRPRAAARRRGAGAAPARARRPRRGRRGVGRRGRRGRRLARGARRQRPGTPRPRGPRPPPSRRQSCRRPPPPRPSTSSPAAARPRPTCSSPRGGRGRGAALAAALPPRGKIVAPAAATGVADLLAGARARAALCRAEAAVPERVDATLPEAAAPPPAEAPGPAPAPLARGTRVRYKDGTLGSVAKCHHDDFPPYYDVALAGGRVVQCERGSLEVVDRRAAVEAKLRRRAPKEIRPALGAETVAAAGEALDALPSTAVSAALEPRGRSALAIAAARNDANLVTALRDRGAPPERRDFAGRTAADAAPSTRVARAVRFGAGEDAAPALDFGRGAAPCGPSTGTSTSRAPRGRGRRARTTWARAIIFDDGEAVPVEKCDLRAGRSALDVYEPLRAQLENQRVSSLAGALVDELAEEFVLGFRDQGRELEREAAASGALRDERRRTGHADFYGGRGARGALRTIAFECACSGDEFWAPLAGASCASGPGAGARLRDAGARRHSRGPREARRRPGVGRSGDREPRGAHRCDGVRRRGAGARRGPRTGRTFPRGGVGPHGPAPTSRRRSQRGGTADPATGPKQIFAAGEQATGPKRLGEDDATFAPGARVIYKDGSSGVVQKAHHDDPEGVYYTVDLGPGRVINALHKSLRPQDDLTERP